MGMDGGSRALWLSALPFLSDPTALPSAWSSGYVGSSLPSRCLVPDWHAARDSSLAAKDERFIVSRADIELTLGTCEDLSIFDSEEREHSGSSKE